MSALNNSSKNKNELITKLLTADNIELYCQKEIDIDINITNTEKICGDILKGNVSEVKVSLIDKDEEKLGDFDATVDNAKKQWCIKTKENEIESGVYTITAVATDKNDNTATATKEDANISDLNPTYELSIDDIGSSLNNKPNICGKVLQSDFDTVKVNLQNTNGENFGPFDAIVNSDNKTWCAKINDELPNGKYDVTAYGYKGDKEVAQALTQFDIFIIAGLYNSLDNEFKNDYEKWNASLDKDTLTFRFHKPSVLFDVSSSKMQEKFKSILSDFFPRYIKILLKHKKDIKNVIIEGHSSSEYKLAKSDEEKYDLNLKLSQGRADEVLKYVIDIPNDVNVDNIMWIVSTFKAKGFSSSKLILNEDGTENKEKSRRVDFTIKTKAGDSI
jgi:outer membrane protein OmpA-like peptidoglycan-associated protein